jgi:hypothetical protein
VSRIFRRNRLSCVLRRKAGNSCALAGAQIASSGSVDGIFCTYRFAWNKIIGLTPWKRKIMSIRIQLLAYQALSERLAVKAF